MSTVPDDSVVAGFLVLRGNGASPATLTALDGKCMISVHVACELRAGAELSRRPLVEHEALDRLLSGLLIACPDDRFAAIYGRTLAAIERSGRRIGAFDLLIATAALADDAPLVTNNVKHFNAVPGLRIVTY